MKKNLISSICLFVLLVLSCSKKEDAVLSRQSSLKYTYSGTSYEIKGSMTGSATTGSVIGKDDATSSTMYLLFNGENSSPIIKVVGIPLSNNSVNSTGTYTIQNQLMDFWFNGSNYYGNGGTNFSTVITSISNNFASGTFSLNNFQKSSGTGPSKITITGEFTNVKIQ